MAVTVPLCTSLVIGTGISKLAALRLAFHSPVSPAEIAYRQGGCVGNCPDFNVVSLIVDDNCIEVHGSSRIVIACLQRFCSVRKVIDGKWGGQ